MSPDRIAMIGLAGLIACIFLWALAPGPASPPLSSTGIVLAPVVALLVSGFFRSGRTWSGLVALCMVAYIGGTVTEIVANPDARTLSAAATIAALTAFVAACVQLRSSARRPN